MEMKRAEGRFAVAAIMSAALALAGCASTGNMQKPMADNGMADQKPMADSGSMKAASGMAAPMMAMDPMKSGHAVIDRFSSAAGHLQVRDGMNDLPGPNQPVDFDKGPFVTTGLGPKGETVMYYNFDVQSTTPAPIYVLYRTGEMKPVDGQLNIVDAIPGHAGYNDFWELNKVTVPADYKANTVGSLKALMDAGYPIERTSTIVNCPIVPDGSTARHRLNGNDTGLHMGWYRDKVVTYFNFSEASLMAEDGNMVPTSPIYVTFNMNPGMGKGGPASGFRMVKGSMQTHNVVAALPGDMHYSPLWAVSVYDSAEFDKVMDLGSAMHAMAEKAASVTVNCPIYSVSPSGM